MFAIWVAITTAVCGVAFGYLLGHYHGRRYELRSHDYVQMKDEIAWLKLSIEEVEETRQGLEARWENLMETYYDLKEAYNRKNADLVDEVMELRAKLAERDL